MYSITIMKVWNMLHRVRLKNKSCLTFLRISCRWHMVSCHVSLSYWTLMIVRFTVDDNDIIWIKFVKHLLSLYRSQGALEYWIRILELHDHDMIRSMWSSGKFFFLGWQFMLGSLFLWHKIILSEYKIYVPLQEEDKDNMR